jgi:hypothetical protein
MMRLLQQRFATGVMGLKIELHGSDFCVLDFRIGSKAEMLTMSR